MDIVCVKQVFLVRKMVFVINVTMPVKFVNQALNLIFVQNVMKNIIEF